MADLWQNLLVWTLIGGCVAYVARRAWFACASSRPSAALGGACGGGCAQCPSRAATLVTLTANTPPNLARNASATPIHASTNQR